MEESIWPKDLLLETQCFQLPWGLFCFCFANWFGEEAEGQKDFGIRCPHMKPDLVFPQTCTGVLGLPHTLSWEEQALGPGLWLAECQEGFTSPSKQHNDSLCQTLPWECAAFLLIGGGEVMSVCV